MYVNGVPPAATSNAAAGDSSADPIAADVSPPSLQTFTDVPSATLRDLANDGTQSEVMARSNGSAPDVPSAYGDEMGSSQEPSFQEGNGFQVAGVLENVGGLFGGDDRANKSIASLRQEINSAAAHSKVDPMVVATILYAEQRHRSPEDGRQDDFARKALSLGPTPLRDVTLNSINGDWSMGGKDIRHNVTLGAAQMSVDGVHQLMGGDKGGKNYLSHVVSRDRYNEDPLGTALALLTNDKYAPALIAAWSQRLIETRSGRAGSNDGKKFQYADFSVSNPQTHYIFLTGTYSQGGFFKAGNGKPDPKLNSNPLSHTDWIQSRGPNQSATNAIELRDDVWKALTGQNYRRENDPMFRSRF
jgi:hypothetical protein